MSAADRGRSASVRSTSRGRSISTEDEATDRAAAKELVMARGLKMIDSKNGELYDFEPSESDLKALAPKIRAVKRRPEDDAAITALSVAIDKLIELKQSTNVYHATTYLNTLLGGKSVAAAVKEQIIPGFMTALLQKRKGVAEDIARRLARGDVAKALLTVKAVNAAVAKAVTARAEKGKTTSRSVLDEVSAAIAVAMPEFAGYKPTVENVKTYQALKNTESLDRLDRYLAKPEVAARIRATLAKRAATKGVVSRAAGRSVEPVADIEKLMNSARAVANIRAYLGEGEEVKNSNIRRLAELRARGLNINARSYFRAIRPVFTVRKPKGAKKAAAAGSNSGSSNNGAAAGAGAGAAPRGRSATRKAAKPNNATMEAIAAAMGMGE